MSRTFIHPRGEPLATYETVAAGVVQLQSKRAGLLNATVLTSGAGYPIYGPPPTLAIAATSADKAEGDSGTTSFTFTVTRAGDLTRETTVDWAVTGTGGSAANAADFGGALPSGTLTFAADDASEVITVSVSGDTDIESNEDFTVTISNAVNGSIITATAGGTIQNDDGIIEPGGDWDGTPGSGFTSAPTDPTRTTAKPACRLLVPPNQYFTDTLLVGVLAMANNEGTLLDNLGLEQVNVYFENDTPIAIQAPSFQTFQDANGNDVSYYGWWIVLKKPTGTAGHAHIYFEAVPSDSTMQNRVIGPYQFSPQTSKYDYSVTVAAGGGGDYTTIAAAQAYLYGQSAENPLITITEAGDYTWGVGSPYEGEGYLNVTATAAVTITTTGALTLLRPRWDGVHIFGENITLDHNIYYQLYHENPAQRKHWLDGITLTDSGGRYYLYQKGQRVQTGVRDGAYFTECTISYLQDICGGAPLVRGCTLHGGCRDVMSDATCCVDTVVYDWTSKEWRTLVNALTVQYTGAAGTATLSLSGSNEANNRVFTAKEDGTSVSTFTIVNNNPAGNYDVQDVADWINGLTGWTATVLDDTRRASALGAPGTYGAFTDLDVKTSAKTLDTFFDQHADMAQFISANENIIYWGLTGWGLSTQNIYTGASSGMKDQFYVNCSFALDETDPDTVALFSQMISSHSHVVVAHCTLPDQSLRLRADLSSGFQYNPDTYCLISNNAITSIVWSGTPDGDVTIDSNITDDFAVHDTAPTGATNHSYGGDKDSKFPDRGIGDFKPAGEILTNLKTAIVERDSAGLARSASDVTGSRRAPGDPNPATLSSPVDTANADVAMTGSVFTNQDNGRLYWFISTSATPPTAADLKTGTGAVVFGSKIVSATGTQNISDNGLTAETTYYTHYLHRNAAGDDSDIATADGFTTTAPVDATAPTLSSPTGTSTGTSTADLSVSTNEDNGTLYWFVSASATPPSSTDLKAGTGAVASGNQAVSATGTQSASVTGLSVDVAYYAHFLHRDAAGNDSSIATSSSFASYSSTIDALAAYDATLAIYDWTDPASMTAGDAGPVVQGDGDTIASVPNYKTPGSWTLTQGGSTAPTYNNGADFPGTQSWLAAAVPGGGGNAPASTTLVFIVKSTDVQFMLACGATGTSWCGAVEDGSSSAPHSGMSPTYRVNGTPLSSPTRDDLHTAIATGSAVVVTVTGANFSAASASDIRNSFGTASFFATDYVMLTAILDGAEADHASALTDAETLAGEFITTLGL